MKLSPLEMKLYNIASPVVEDLGFRIVLVKSFGYDGDHTIQVLAEDPKTGRLGVDDCAKLSRAISVIFDVENPIESAYKLELSSPGIDRPLVKLEDYDRYKDLEVKIEIDLPLENGQKKFRGIIKKITDSDVIIIDNENNELSIPYGAITKSKLVLNDELIKKTKSLI